MTSEPTSRAEPCLPAEPAGAAAHAGADLSALRLEIAELRAALQAAHTAAADAQAAAVAARELNVRLLAASAPAVDDGELATLRARAALVDEIEATRIWRLAAGPRRVYAALRRRAGR